MGAQVISWFFRAFYAFIFAFVCLYYAHPLPRRGRGRFVSALLFLLLIAGHLLFLTCFIQGGMTLLLYQSLPYLLNIFYFLLAFRCDFPQALFLGATIYLSTDFVCKAVQHVVAAYWSPNLFLSPEAPLLSLISILACLGIDLLVLLILRKILPAGESGQFTAIKLAVLICIIVPVFYLGNIENFLPLSTERMPLNLSLIRTLLCLLGLGALAEIGYALKYRESQRETAFIRRLMQEQHQQYLLRQDTIQALNRECHDLKHQLSLLHLPESPELRAQYAQRLTAITANYESLMQTGNPTLDLILTERQLQCQKSGIRLTCMVDPAPLGHISPVDLCSIFGNALDNAIESAAQVAEEERRIVEVQVFQRADLAYICFENYFDHSLRWRDGELETTKKGRSYHGYGIKSMRFALQQYGGQLSIDARDHWFCLNIIIPLAPGGQAPRS